MSELHLVQGDVGIVLRGALLNDDTEGPLDITGCDVYFQMRKSDDLNYQINGLCANINEPGGLVTYKTGANDLGITGDFLGQFEVRYPDDTIQTTKDWLKIKVRKQ